MNYPTRYEEYAEYYDEQLKEESAEFIIPLTIFIKNNTLEYFSSEEQKDEPPSVNKSFWKFFHTTYSQLRGRYSEDYSEQNNEISTSPEKIILEFKEQYLSNKYLKLHDVAEKNISDETFSGFELYIVNVGIRNFETNRSGWTTNNFQVINIGKKYSFISSTKDEKGIEGEFINIFVLQKKYLVKISLTLDESERTPYFIQRDCEKTSLKNECEIHIAKHHGNETIIFDSKKEALAFQAKLLEIREGRRYER